MDDDKKTYDRNKDNKPIIVLGGTHYDAELGEKHLRQYDVQATPVGLSKNPIDQTLLQSCDKAALHELVSSELRLYSGAHVIVYCNSLSFAIDWKRTEQITQCTFHTLTQPYDRIGRTYDKIAIISANTCMLQRASSYLASLNPDMSIMGFSYLPIICKIEDGDPDVPGILESTIDICEKTGVEAVIMGCTHFENIDLAHRDLIHIVYPGKMLLDGLFTNNNL